jgi:hypothetical protein
MMEAKPVESWDEQLTATYPAGEFVPLDYTVPWNAWPVISRRFRQFLEREVPGHVQYLPFRLRGADGKGEKKGYCVGQILRMVDCLDRKRTTIAGSWDAIDEGKSVQVRGPVVLERRKCARERFFRVAGYNICIVVRQDLKEAIEEAEFLGTSFRELDVSA